jgi:hypothetical protein
VNGAIVLSLTRRISDEIIGSAMADPLLEPFAFERANAVQKALRRFAASGPGSWLFARVLHRIDRPVYQDDRRRRIWEEGLRVYPGSSQYERRASNRRIAVFLLEPI